MRGEDTCSPVFPITANLYMEHFEERPTRQLAGICRRHVHSVTGK